MRNFKNKSLLSFISAIIIDWGFTIEGLKDNRKGEWWFFLQLMILLAHFVPAWPVLTNWPFIIKLLSVIIIVSGMYQ